MYVNKKLMSINDLYEFCLKNNFTHFSHSNSNYEICVQMPANGRFAKEEQDKHKEGLRPFVAKAYHDNINLNKSEINPDVFKENTKSAVFRPILAHIITNEETGEKDFGAHDFTIVEDENGESVIVYQEQPVGVINGDFSFEYDEEQKVTRAVLNGYLYEEYCRDAIEILDRRNDADCSIELSIREMSFNAANKTLVLDDYFITGLTILGADKKPGMAGSNIKLADFSVENNSVFSHAEINTKLVEALDKLNKKLDGLSVLDIDKTIFEKGGKSMSKLEELLEKYGKTEEDLDFETEGLSDEELEAKFAEVFGEAEGNPVPEDGEEGSEDDFATCKPKKKKKCSEEGAEESEEDEEEGEEQEEGFATCKPKKKKKCSREVRELENGNREVAFELSHDDIRYALYNLITQFEELDNEWYMISAVYDDHFVMESWSGNYIYGCKYVVDGDNVSLDGERYRLYKELLTESEKAELDSMRSNYSAIEEKLHKYEKAELDAQKEAIFEDVSYSEYLETEEFKSLIANIDNYSVDELKDKAEIAFAKCVKKEGKFAAKPEETLPRKSSKHIFAKANSKDKKSSIYGNIFANKN